jgi:hypothetical protein
MTRKIKTEKVLGAFNVLNTAKYAKMDDADKIKVWKIARALKPIATKFDEDSKDAAEKLKPEGFDDDLRKAQEYERVTKDKDADASKLEMGASEYGEFIKKLKEMNKLVADALKEFADKEVDIDFEPISEDAFTKLMASNDWTVEQTMIIGDLIVI